MNFGVDLFTVTEVRFDLFAVIINGDVKTVEPLSDKRLDNCLQNGTPTNFDKRLRRIICERLKSLSQSACHQDDPVGPSWFVADQIINICEADNHITCVDQGQLANVFLLHAR